MCLLLKKFKEKKEKEMEKKENINSLPYFEVPCRHLQNKLKEEVPHWYSKFSIFVYMITRDEQQY